MVFMIKIIIFTFILTFTQALIGNFLHITDIHYDPNYKEGAPVNCVLGKTGLGCCREFDIPIQPYEKANKWGNFACDTPYLFINKTFEWIKYNIKDIDFIIYTGDSVGHHDITQSISQNIKTINEVDNMFKIHFNNIKVYSSIGNHDTYPIDQTQKNVNEIFLNNFANQWGNWLNNSVQNNVKQGGFYSIKISDNMYIVNFNSLLYDNENRFKNNHLEARDIQWQWFENTLEKIKNENSSAWIINHICPYSGEAETNYTHKFINIVSNYKDIIKYQFYGHTHNDRFTLLEKNNDIVGFCSIPSSLMLDNHESSFRIYEYDKNNFDILNYYQYTSNLQKTIEANKIIYNHTYSFNEEYNMQGVNLENWKKLYNDIKKNDTILNKYYNHLTPGLNHTQCNSQCKNDLLTDILPDKFKF